MPTRKHYTQKHRDRIAGTKILDRLIEHGLSEKGDILTPSQVRTNLGLLAKVLPDLKSTEHSMDEATTELVVKWRDQSK